MAAEEITCPYCNSFVTGAEASGPRILCPRCGEQFTRRVPAETASAPEHPAAPSVSPVEPQVPMPRRFSNRTVVLAVVGVMLMMSVVGLVLALETVSFRRDNDAHLLKPQIFGIPLILKIVGSVWLIGLVLILLGLWQRKGPSARSRWVYGVGISLAVVSTVMILFSGPIRRRSSQLASELDTPSVRSLEPEKLEALRYLPVDTNIVAGVHVAELLQERAGREFLDGLRIAALHFTAERLESWTGLKRDDIDYVVIGLKVEDQLIPRTTLIARARTPVDSERLREALKGTVSADDTNRFHFKIAGTALEAEARCVPHERLLIVGLTRADLEAVPDQPHQGLDRLPPRLVNVLRNRVDRRARAWTVGQVDDWDRTAASWWLNLQPEQDRATLKQIRSFGAWMLFDDPVVVRAEVEADDEQAAVGLAHFVDKNRGEVFTDLKIPKPRDAWVSMQARMTAKAVQEAFRK